MNAIKVLIPFAMIFLGMVGVTIYCLAVAVRDSIKRLTEMNKDLMIMLATRESGGEAARALVAASRKPKKDIPGVAKEKKEEKPKGYTVKVGAR